MARKPSKKHRKQISRAARRALDKKSRKGNRDKALRLQIVPLWKRVVMGLSSLIPLGFAILLYPHTLVGAIICAFLFILLLGMALVGKRKTVDDGLRGVDAGISVNVLGKIFDNLF